MWTYRDHTVLNYADVPGMSLEFWRLSDLDVLGIYSKTESTGNGNARNAYAVSYTHLDVYKRQGLL